MFFVLESQKNSIFNYSFEENNDRNFGDKVQYPVITMIAIETRQILLIATVDK